MVENILGKGENAGYQHFLLFPKCFQMPSSLGVVESRDFVVHVKSERGGSYTGLPFVYPSFCPSNIFVTLFSATIAHIHLKLGMLLQVRILHVTYRI